MQWGKLFRLTTVLFTSVTLLSAGSVMAEASVSRDDARVYDAVAVAKAAGTGYDAVAGVKIPDWVLLRPNFVKRVKLKHTLVHNRYSAFGISIKNLKQNIKVISKDINANGAAVTIEIDSRYQYGNGSPVIENMQTTVHLLKQDGKFVVDSIDSLDSFDMTINDSAVSYRADLDMDSQIIQQELNNIAEEKSALENTHKKVVTGESRSVSNLNRTAMKQYQEKYAYTYNKNEPDFSGPNGGDCTNFASQVLKAGGATFDTSGPWSQQWFFKGWAEGSRTPSWGTVYALRQYLLTNANEAGKLTGKEVNYLYMKVGDPIFIDFGDNGSYDHTVVTYTPYDSNGFHNITVSAHTTNALGRDITTYSGKKSMVTVS